MTQEEKQKRFKELLPIIIEYYKDKKYFDNAYYKLPISNIKIGRDPDEDIAYIEEDLNEKHFGIFSHKDMDENILCIKYECNHGGLIYADGNYADLCDKHGNIIQVTPDLEINKNLEDIRKFLHD